MSFDDYLDRLTTLVNDAGPQLDISVPAARLGVELPPAHLRLLARFNGGTAFHGAFRLFGIREEPYLDLRAWNARDTWRFAWDDRVEPYFCFGETAWGDQYAYKRSPDGGLEPQVYELDASFLSPDVLADTFEEFLRDDFLRNAEQPYDSLTVAAYERLGPLDASRHWGLSPSLALGGDELIENVMLLPAVTAMIIAGDIATAIDRADEDAVLAGVEPWRDEEGRGRMRVLFD